MNRCSAHLTNLERKQSRAVVTKDVQGTAICSYSTLLGSGNSTQIV